jgi:hypothetical protein
VSSDHTGLLDEIRRCGIVKHNGSKSQQRRQLSVYDGQIFLGRYVVEKNGNIRAFTPEEKPLGKFLTEKAAIDAVAAAHAGLLKHKRKPTKRKHP